MRTGMENVEYGKCGVWKMWSMWKMRCMENEEYGMRKCME